MAEPVVLGIDPDSRNTAWALATVSRLLAVGVVRGLGDDDLSQVTMLRNTGLAFDLVLKQHEVNMAVVEGQEIHYGGKAAPIDILRLALVAGGIVGQLIVLQPPLKMCVPLPSEWKKQVPKPVNQARTYTHFGILTTVGKDYTYPSGCAAVSKVAGYGKLRQTDWKHVGDAAGLALYGAKLLSSVS